ncbi:MAG: FkbM family methyltransferase [Patescibacteria group bacterium]
MNAEHKIISFAQNREDVILAAFFPDIEHGFYVDIGAHHPTEDSVTKYFYNRGWRGINVEPNKEMYRLLSEERLDDTNVNVGIADKQGTLKLRVYEEGDGLSTFSEEMKKEYSTKSNAVTTKFHDDVVEVITLQELFEKHKPYIIHFLKIDIEGYEYNALRGNDWVKYRPEVICIEANHVVHDWRPILTKAGYELIFFDGLNEYYSSSKHRTAAFSYVKFALGENVIFYKDHEQIMTYKNTVRSLKQDIGLQEAREFELRREIVHRDALLAETKRFRIAFKNLTQAVDKIFMIQISRFSHPKRKHASRNIEIDTDIAKLSDEELLITARKVDLQNYYTFGKASGSFKGQYAYNTVLFSYKLAKKAIKLPLKFGFRTLQTLRRMGRKRG